MVLCPLLAPMMAQLRSRYPQNPKPEPSLHPPICSGADAPLMALCCQRLSRRYPQAKPTLSRKACPDPEETGRALGRVTRHLLSQLACLAWASSNHHQGPPSLPHPFYQAPGLRPTGQRRVRWAGAGPGRRSHLTRGSPRAIPGNPCPGEFRAHAAAFCLFGCSYNLARTEQHTCGYSCNLPASGVSHSLRVPQEDCPGHPHHPPHL